MRGCIALINLICLVTAISAAVLAPRAALDDWVSAETNASLAGTLANIGPAKTLD